MHNTLKLLLVTACVFGSVVKPTHPAHASGFTDFAADEDTCRRAGTAAIQGGSGPAAAARYDYTYRRCMAFHGNKRQMDAYAGGPPGPGPAYRDSNPHTFEYPDAFFSVPYATPGYGYDGFSW